MNKELFGIFKGLESGSPRAPGKKNSGRVPTETLVPVTPERLPEESPWGADLWTFERYKNVRLGEVMHEALSHVKSPEDAPRAEAAVNEIWNAQGRWFDEKGIIARIQKLLSSPAMAAFLPRDAEVHNEAAFCDLEGDLWRMDKVIVRAGEVQVVDYKAGMEARDHSVQIKKYMSILESLYPGRKIRGFVIRIQDGDVQEIL